LTRSKKGRPILWLTLAAVAIAAAATGYFRGRADEGTAIQYQTTAVTRADVADRVTASGTLSPLVTVQVGSQVSGTIKDIFVDFNAHVTRGQVIAKIDPRLFEAEVARASANVKAAEAGVAKAQAELDNATVSYERTKALRSSTLVAQSELDASRATYRSAEAELKATSAALSQAQAAMSQAETNLAYTTIVSPIDGVVISRDMDVGQTVAASFQTPTLFTIAGDLSKMEVHTDVAESDVGRVQPGMAVEFTVDAYPHDSFSGTVKEVRYSPQTVQNVVTYDAVVSVDNSALKLRPGMTADVSFIVEEHRNVLVVPNAALRFSPPEEIASKYDLEGLVSAETAGSKPHRPWAGSPAAATASDDAAGRHERTSHTGATTRARTERVARRIVWIQDAGGDVAPVVVTIGISDGHVTEITDGAVSEGARVVIAANGGTAASDNKRMRFGRFL
jgi:HlyD family secretion protein